MKKVCVVTGNRAEYGLLRLVIEGIKNSMQLQLQLVVTGMHLSSEFGLTIDEIIDDGFPIARKVEMLLSSDTPTGVSKSMGLGVIGFADVLADLKPDVMLVLGDRYEIFAASAAATIARIPIAHIHGGEASEGAIDEAMRHSITKMSHLHFVAAEEYRRRVIQLGEHPQNVFNVGGLGVDCIRQTKLLSRKELEAALGLELCERNLLITFHPVTLEGGESSRHMNELLGALRDLQDTRLIFTLPNADAESRVIFKQIEIFCSTHPLADVYASLGQMRYLSCMKHFDGVVGNSSSGLLEAPALKTGTVNIGERQRGRLRALSVIDCEPTSASISKAISRLFSNEFSQVLKDVRNPYGEGGASERIVRELETRSVDGILKKRFYDVGDKIFTP